MSMVDSQRNQIKFKVQEIAKEHEAELIELKVFLSGGKYIVRCLIDYLQGGITINECALINKRIVSCIEESNFLDRGYTVEVNSPGLDRPLTSYKDFLRTKGRLISLWLNEPFCEKEYLEGELMRVDEDSLILNSKDEVLKIDFAKIKLGKEKIKI
ncbi:MAG: hypothetical protein ABIK26_01260 [Candidatus Omnitrophota bacterium]